MSLKVTTLPTRFSNLATLIAQSCTGKIETFLVAVSLFCLWYRLILFCSVPFYSVLFYFLFLNYTLFYFILFYSILLFNFFQWNWCKLNLFLFTSVKVYSTMKNYSTWFNLILFLLFSVSISEIVLQSSKRNYFRFYRALAHNTEHNSQLKKKIVVMTKIRRVFFLLLLYAIII